MIGYNAVLHQLVRLKVLKEPKIQLKSQFFTNIFEMYNKMGDTISMQYGGSKAHHASMAKKKGHGIGELVTSVSRHW
mgnify:CR=1 FL=1|jgi:hypothetical protein